MKVISAGTAGLLFGMKLIVDVLGNVAGVYVGVDDSGNLSVRCVTSRSIVRNIVDILTNVRVGLNVVNTLVTNLHGVVELGRQIFGRPRCTG